MIDEEIKSIIEKQKERPHLVILGAGATVATIPNGDKKGNKSSVMNNFIKELGLEEIIEGIKLDTNSPNLEDIYSELFDREDCKEIRMLLENKIDEYFSKLRLPDKPTIYDLLILSLRGKDAIATFNWDPLLLEAYNRVNKITKDLPELIFLHGCVHVGICKEHARYGTIKSKCPTCGKRYCKVPLLYPVNNKDYSNNEFIKHSWDLLREYMSEAIIVTIFGYGAPSTDVEAIKIFENAYGDETRYFD